MLVWPRGLGQLLPLVVPRSRGAWPSAGHKAGAGDTALMNDWGRRRGTQALQRAALGWLPRRAVRTPCSAYRDGQRRPLLDGPGNLPTCSPRQRQQQKASPSAPGGETLRRAVMKTKATGRTWAEEPKTGGRRDLSFEGHRAFWTWAMVEVLRHTGLRIEELTELSHHSLIQYHVPTSGELVPLLQVAPSKTDQERLLVVSPELADVLAAIVGRVRDDEGRVPLVVSYDKNERLYNPPMPLLFQCRRRLEDQPVTETALREYLDHALERIGVIGPDGRTLRYTFHDFRRMFITDAILHGMPPHIAQLVVGHRDIATTMGYKAVYPEEAINSHRAFLARRRSLRPSEEYRTPTDQEWEEFVGHFERRKLALGTCGRSYATPCPHEHACIRCPMLRPDPAARPRFQRLLGSGHQAVLLGQHLGASSHRLRQPSDGMSMSSVQRSQQALGLAYFKADRQGCLLPRPAVAASTSRDRP